MGTTALSEEYVFLTKSHDHAANGAIWIVKRFEPDNQLIELYKVEPGVKVGTVRVTCSESRPSKAKVEVTYCYQALSASGETFVAALDAAAGANVADEIDSRLTEDVAQRPCA